MKRINLGSLEVSAQGLGCMGMSEYYGPSDWDSNIEVIHTALDTGVTHLDTADQYGYGHNEVLVGRAIAGRRDQVELATKFGFDRTHEQRVIRGNASFVRQSCEASLLRLGVEHIDLYYMHRPPSDVPIEETVGAMSELVSVGKVRYIGLSEVNENLLRRAHAVHPITAVQSEYSIWTRNVEEITPAMAELGIGLVGYSPLGRGFLARPVDGAELAANDFRHTNERFRGHALEANRAIFDAIAATASKLRVTAPQVALAWVMFQQHRLGIPVVPIPGTRSTQRLVENASAEAITLDAAVLGELEKLAATAAGHRYGVVSDLPAD